MNLCNLAQSLSKNTNPTLVIVDNAVNAEKLYRSINTLNRNNDCRVILLPDRETRAYEKVFVRDQISAQRFKALHDISKQKYTIIITTIASTTYRLPPKEYIAITQTKFSVGQNISLYDVTKSLSTNGFNRCDLLEKDGEYTIRGNLLEFNSQENQYRIEWFDDTIENIWQYSKNDKKYHIIAEPISILPQHEMLLNQSQRETLAKYWLEQDKEAATYPEFKYLNNNLPIEGVEDLIPIVFNPCATIFDFLPKTTEVWAPSNTASIMDNLVEEIHENFNTLSLRSGIIPPPPPSELFDIWHTRVTYNEYTFNNTNTIIFKHKNHEKRLMELNTNDKQTIITCINPDRRRKLIELCDHLEIDTIIIESPNEITQHKQKIALLIGDFCWSYEFKNFLILPEYALFQQQQTEKKKTKQIYESIQLNPKDYVVHEDYGIGQYIGLVVINEQEFMQVMYKNQANIFISIDQFHLLSKYHVQENITLDELGSKNWKKTTKKAKELTYDYAAEILKVNAKRQILKGIPLACPSEYNTFKNEFLYTETPDQITAIEQTILDLSKSTPMDRLICGDVGFGKTEIAIRAAFITAFNQRQVLFIAPTTLLASQHYHNIQERFKNWPFKVRLLTAQTKSKKLLKEISSGQVDIIITTHVVLRTALDYKALSLIIIDEEHRFGVKDKDFIKRAHPNIHCLSMSATPIPRSLNFALSSLRDISLISTPPKQRTDIITKVIQHNDESIMDAINRELQRGGQIYLVHNDVETIQKVCAFWQSKSNIIVADYIHGKMSQSEQDQKMFAFSEHKINLLVATTIIESGIDIPNANTLIVLRADKFGLAQLHQLRGRVGRSNRQAYAYFFTPDPVFLKKNALSRLNAINTLSSLGSGYQLAVHDLEIRGTGSILGDSQSGMIKGVGYDLYLSMLKQACEDLELVDKSDSIPIEYQTYFPLMIPPDYLPDTNKRLSIYQAIAKANNETLEEIESYLGTQYGAPPYITTSLIKLKKLVNSLHAIGCISINIKKEFTLLSCKPKNEKIHLKLIDIIKNNSNLIPINETELKFNYLTNEPITPHMLIDYINFNLLKAVE